MKRWLALLLVGLFCFSLPAAAVEYAPNDVPQLRLAAHRGYSAVAPENTLAAFRTAGKAGFAACECDIYPTTDGQWAVFHDGTLDRMTDGGGRVTDQTFAALSAYHIDAGENIALYPNERIPELGEYLAVCNEFRMVPVIEVKGGTPEQMEDLAGRLRAETDVAQVCLVVTKGDSLLALNRLLPEASVFLLTYFTLPGDLCYCEENGLDGIDFCWPLTPAITAKAIQSRGLRAAVWTVNSVLDAAYLQQFGVEFVTTNGLASPLTGFWRTVVNTWNVVVDVVYGVLASI